MTRWLVTGGAGYIGSHVVRALQVSGREVVVLDDLSSGRAEFAGDVPLVVGSIDDRDSVAKALAGCDGVIHVAAFKYAGVSVREPLTTYRANLAGTITLLEGMVAAGVPRIVFSSSAGIYGTPDAERVTEATPHRPESPYGASKSMGERVIDDTVAAVDGMRGVSLRYFNVVGSGHPDVWDVSPHNLFPLVMRRLVAGEVPAVNGTDYPTPDGSCVRDYVHVSDVALAHVEAATAQEEGRALASAYNLGSGDGLSVLQIMDAFRRATGVDFEPEIRGRRPGDPARIVADGTAAARDIGWAMRHSVDDMVTSAWASWPKDGSA